MVDKPYKLAVKAVIFDAQGRGLLLRRSNISKHFAGQWEWPGGKVDAGEDFATAVLRETREETGLEVAITGLAGATHFEMEALHVILLCMEARVTGGVLKLSEEHDALAWVAPKDWAHTDLTPQVKPFMLEYATRPAKGR